MTLYHRYINQLSVSVGDWDLLQGTGMASFTSDLSQNGNPCFLNEQVKKLRKVKGRRVSATGVPGTSS